MPPNLKDHKRHRILWSLLVIFMLTAISAGAGYWYMFIYTGDLTNGKCRWLIFKCSGEPIDLEKLSYEKLKRTTYIRDRNGQIIQRFFEEVRNPTKLKTVPLLLRYGLIAAEDKRYYSGIFYGYIDHPGVDPIAILRAAIGNSMPSKIARYMNYSKLSGASSIHMQLSMLKHTDDIPEFKARTITYSRKIKQAKIAIQLARRYSKERVLEEMFNIIYFGHGVNGISEATLRYFGKDINSHAEITLREIAILVSLNKSPVAYCPIFHRPNETVLDKEIYNRELAKEIIRVTKARERYNWVLKRMLEDRYISQQEHDNAYFKKDEPFELEPMQITPLNNPLFSYGGRFIKEFLLSNGFSDAELSYYGGLQIYTTFDYQLQQIITDEFKKHLELLNAGKPFQDHLNGAFVVIDIKTGEIRAMTGGYDFNESQYNRLLAYRSPGSGYKPVVYATALEQGYDLFSKFCNTPFTMVGANGEPWSPQNFRDKNPRPSDCNRDLAEGVIYSLNLETLNIARRITIDRIITLSNKLGIWGNPDIIRDSHGDIWFRKPRHKISGGLVSSLPTAIGASDLNLLELANAYTVFFREGIYKKPTLIREIIHSDGKELFRVAVGTSYEERVVSKETADKIIAMMRAVTKIGTAKISMRNIEQEVACKTGTSDGPRDVSMWCGTPDLVIAIRIGHDDYKVIELPEYMQKVSGDLDMQVSGGWVVGPLMRKIIDRIYAERVKLEFSPDVEDYLQLILSKIN